MSANKYRGEVPIRLDRVRTLKFTFNAFAEFETMTGQSIQGVFSDSESIGFNMMRNLLWAGLMHEDATLTVKKTGELMELADGSNLTKKIESITGCVVKAVQYAFTDPDSIPDEEEGNPKKKQKS
jgi:hypothetical protein|tara:strand:+ start:1471 stop:1845 length:375 start_codon:yes stop_codon:yes gene_type:complete